MSYLGQVELKSSEIRRIDVTGSTSATHTLTWTPASEQSLIITINGIKQQNNYSISGVTLTLDDALLSDDKMEVIGILDIGEATIPPDDSITTAMVKDDAIDADKLANSINTEIAANTAKVTNATHTGDVTGATALTIATDAVDIAMLSATGTADSTTFLRGDNAWASAGGNNAPAFQVARNSPHQSIPDDTETKVEFNREVYDPDGVFDSTTNYRFTVPAGEGGNYLVGGSLHVEAASYTTLSAVAIDVKVNGSDIVYSSVLYGSSYIRRQNQPWQSLLVLSAADYVEVFLQTNTTNTAATEVVGNGTYSYSWFWGFKLV